MEFLPASSSSRFISQAEIDEKRKEGKEEPTNDAPYDPRTLYERLQEQKAQKDEALQERMKSRTSMPQAARHHWQQQQLISQVHCM
jgi:hypothetical protein